jgi:hypothetical protein
MNGSNRQLLATHVARLSGAQFEEFCISWLVANQNLPFLGGNLIHAQPFGRPGQNQNGIDIACDVERPADSSTLYRIRVVAQCKRVKEWTDQKTLDAIAKATHPADEYVLILALPTDEKIQRVIDQHNDSTPVGIARWSVWFIDDIQRLIESHLRNDKGARLLTEYFGATVSSEILGHGTMTTLVLTDEYFEGNNGSLKHQHKIEGRTIELQQLLSFLKDDDKQALILPAPGGQGKTRLLAELAQEAAEEKPSRCIRWMTECTPETLDEALRWLPPSNEIILILDDVHRWTQVPEALFAKLRRLGTKIKLVIGTRPYRNTEIQSALIRAGILADQQVRLPELNALNRKELRQLALATLHRDRQYLADPLIDASGSSPLILLLGADHINRAKGHYHLHQDTDFRRTVLTKLIDTEHLAQKAELKKHRVEEWLNLMALLSSAPLKDEDKARWNDLAELTAQDAQRLENLLEGEGYLIIRPNRRSNETQYRLVPDLMADYLACRACFGDDGKVSDLPNRLWSKMGSDSLLPVLLRNLSEAEYIARLTHSHANKVTRQLMSHLEKEYDDAPSWHRRTELLTIWKSIANFHPVEALQQVSHSLLMRNLRTDLPASSEQAFGRLMQTSHKSVLQLCAEIVAIIGSEHEEHTEHCLDLLWQMDAGEYGELLEKIGVVCAINKLGNHQVADTGMSWIKEKLTDPQSLPNPEELTALLHASLDWCFNLTASETYWIDKVTLETETRTFSLGPTRRFRRSALQICETWLRSGFVPAQLAAASYFRTFLSPAHMAVKLGTGGNATNRKAWKSEQADALQMLESIISETDHPTVLWTIRDTLISSLLYVLHEKSGRHRIHDLLESFPDSPDLRIHRLLLSSEDSDTWDDVEWCRETARVQNSRGATPVWDHSRFEQRRTAKAEVWSQLVGSTTAAILESITDITSLRAFIREWQQKLSQSNGASFWNFFRALFDQRRDLFKALVDTIIKDPEGEFDHLFDQLISIAASDTASVTNWTLKVLSSSRSSLNIQGVRSLLFRKSLTEDEIAALTDLAGQNNADVRRQTLRWAKDHVNQDDHRERIFHLLSRMALQPEEHEHWRLFVECLKDGLSPFEQPSAVPHGRQLLDKFLPLPRLDKFELSKLIVRWSRHDPIQVVEFLERRIAKEMRTDPSGCNGYHALPYQLHLRSLESVPDIAQKLETAFQSVLSADTDPPDPHLGTWHTWFETLARGAWPTYLGWVSSSLPSLSGSSLLAAIHPIGTGTQFAFRHPDLLEQLLTCAASEADLATQDRILSKLHLSLHPGFHEATPGKPRQHDLTNRERALELSQKYRHRPILRDFYLSVLNYSNQAIERATNESDWE